MSRFVFSHGRFGLVVSVALLVTQQAFAQCGNLPAIDGRNIPAENVCSPRVTQDNGTGYGDTQPGRTNGNELDALYVSSDNAKLYLGITGNVSTDNQNTILVFIQAY